MPKSASIYALRVGDFIQQTLTGLIQKTLRDPRLTDQVKLGLAITQVHVSGDLAVAQVYCRYSPLVSQANQPELDTDELMEILSGASGFLRSKLAKMLTIKITPELRFRYDNEPEKAERIITLLAAERAKQGG